MKFHGGAHYSDVLYLSWWDLLKLALGFTITENRKYPSLYVRVKLRPSVEPTREQRYSGAI